MRYLVTGATGLLGNNVVRTLLQQGHAVRVLVRGPLPRRELVGLELDWVEGNLNDQHVVQLALADVDCVIHSAGDLHIGWRTWERQRKTNVDGTAGLARAARAAGARFIHVSTVDTLAAARRGGAPVDENSPDQCKVPCTYVVTKREAEQVVRREVDAGLDAVIVNPGFMLGPWDWKPSSGRMLLSLTRHWVPAAPTGGMSVCDVRDVAEGIIAAADRGVTGRRYILAGHNLRFFDAWKRFAGVAGRRGPVFRMGPLVRWVVGYSGDLRAWLGGHESDVNSAMVKMSQLYHYYSSHRAENELGYRIRPLDESVADAWAWFQEFGYA